jgi:exonuclease VII small subunit
MAEAQAELETAKQALARAREAETEADRRLADAQQAVEAARGADGSFTL